MRGGIFLIVFLILFTSLASAEIILTQHPKELYNLGDILTIPATVKTTTELSGILQMDLLCNGLEENFYKNGISLSAGEEKVIEASLILTPEAIGILRGSCIIKAYIGQDFVLTEEFTISNLINLKLKTTQIEYVPEEEIIIEGEATKENGNLANGFIDLTLFIIEENSTSNKTYQGTINNGFFSIIFTLPKETKAGQYLLSLDAYEKDNLGTITNKGFTDYNILIKQVPTSLEIVFENPEVIPGNNLKVKAVLHDQTGEKIESSAIITVKDNLNQIMEQIEKPTDEFLEFSIKYNEPPEEWTVVAVSNKLTSQANFKIEEKESAKIEIINRTLTVTNTGNVPYNKTLLIKISNESLNIDVYLEVDGVKKYLLSAPDGEYKVEIIDNGESELTKTVFLTGKAISVKEISKVLSFVNYPLVWIFVIIILGIIAFIVFKKGYKKSFFGYISKKKEPKSKPSIPIRKGSLLKTRNIAELSLNIKGEKQNSSIICLKIKNLREVEKKEGGVEETLQQVINAAEENKATIYENGDYLFFIFAPVITKTFKNEKTAIKLAQRIKEILLKHNKIAKQKINFGISLNNGNIMAKKEDTLKFLSFGDLMTMAKKTSSASHEEIYLTGKMKDRLGGDVKTEKHHKDGLDIYTVKEIKEKSDRHKTFISEFVKRIEKDNKDKEEKKD